MIDTERCVQVQFVVIDFEPGFVLVPVENVFTSGQRGNVRFGGWILILQNLQELIDGREGRGVLVRGRSQRAIDGAESQPDVVFV